MDAVARIELYHVAVPLPARFHPSWIPGFPQTVRRRFFVMDRRRLAWFSIRRRGLAVSREIDRARKERRARPGAGSPSA